MGGFTGPATCGRLLSNTGLALLINLPPCRSRPPPSLPRGGASDERVIAVMHIDVGRITRRAWRDRTDAVRVAADVEDWNAPQATLAGVKAAGLICDPHGGYLGSTDNRHWDVSPDGQSLLMVKPTSGATMEAAPSQLVLVRNWFQELTRLVPTE